MRQLRSCTVQELLDALEGEDRKAMVVFASNYGDLGKTQQVHAIAGDVEEQIIEESAYSDSGWAVQRREDEDEEPNRPPVTVLVIN